jgi:release factor glutamine methyltransferase
MRLSIERKKPRKFQAFIEGVKIEGSENIYEPHEDSEMLAKAVKENAFGDFLDMGTGSGLQAIIASKSNKVKSVTAVDISEIALKQARKNAKANNAKIKFKKSNLFSNINGTFDCIAFNPPYLPTSKDEKLLGVINLAFDGGKTGRKVSNKFIKQVKKHLKEKGVILMVGSSLSDYEKTINHLKKLGFNVNVIDRKNFFIEEVVIIKAWLR